MKQRIGALLPLGLLCAAGAGLCLTSAIAGLPSAWHVAGGAVCLLALFFMLLEYRRRWNAAQQAAQALQRDLEALRESGQAEQARLRQELKDRVERFRSLLSHELRMPISIIQGYAELLAEDMVADPAVQKEYLNKIIQRSYYMGQVLTQQLLDAREDEYTTPVCARIELLELARQTCRDLSNAAACRGITVQVLSSEQALFVMADRYQLSKIFFNLVENSIKYMRREGIVTIRVSRDETVAEVTVKDDGMGLDAHETEHIFDLNYQGSNRVAGQGHGHGLYLVKRAVEDQGGTISASSHPGMGMTVCFTLPLADAVPAQPARQEAAAAGSMF